MDRGTSEKTGPCEGNLAGSWRARAGVWVAGWLGYGIQLDTIQIRGTIQNMMYYSNSEYEQCKSTHQGVDQAPKFVTIQGTIMLIWWVEH